MTKQIRFESTKGPFFTIPDIVFESRLRPIAFCVYTHMKCLSDGGHAWDGVKGTAAHLRISPGAVRRSLAELVIVGFVVESSPCTPEEARSVLTRKTPQGSVGLFAKCEWCKCQTAWLHAHHYPITRAKGGVLTVKICPNCHAEFHALTRTRYEIAEIAS